jgi:hypothetical protein
MGDQVTPVLAHRAPKIDLRCRYMSVLGACAQ